MCRCQERKLPFEGRGPRAQCQPDIQQLSPLSERKEFEGQHAGAQMKRPRERRNLKGAESFCRMMQREAQPRLPAKESAGSDQLKVLESVMVCPDENMLAVIDDIARRFIDVGVAPAAKFPRSMRATCGRRESFTAAASPLSPPPRTATSNRDNASSSSLLPGFGWGISDCSSEMQISLPEQPLFDPVLYRDHELEIPGELHRPVEDVVAGLLDAQEHVKVNSLHDLRCEHRSFRSSAGSESCALTEVFLRAGFRTPSAKKLRVNGARTNLFPKNRIDEVFLRQVNTAVESVDRDIAENIRQLQRDPKVDGVLLRRGIPRPKNTQTHQSHGRGNKMAILFQFVKRAVTILFQIHLHAADEFVEMFDGNLKPYRDRVQLIEKRVPRIAFRRAFEFLLATWWVGRDFKLTSDLLSTISSVTRQNA